MPTIHHYVVRLMGEVSLSLLKEGNLGSMKLKSSVDETSMQVRKSTLQTLCACAIRSLVLCNVANV